MVQMFARWTQLIDIHYSLEINKIVYKIFGAMSKDLYIEISAHLGIVAVENLIADRRNRFINKYVETYNY